MYLPTIVCYNHHQSLWQIWHDTHVFHTSCISWREELSKSFPQIHKLLSGEKSQPLWVPENKYNIMVVIPECCRPLWDIRVTLSLHIWKYCKAQNSPWHTSVPDWQQRAVFMHLLKYFTWRNISDDSNPNFMGALTFRISSSTNRNTFCSTRYSYHNIPLVQF